MKELIYNALFKESKEVELSKMEVELGLVQDVEKLSDNVFKQAGRFEDVVQEIEKKQTELTKEFIATEKELSILDKTYQQLRKNAQVLGLDVPSESESSYKATLAMIKNLIATYNKYKK